mmetsp:Transcript_36596/g.103339  ORF Transcript_36596/g.103339 Transcript_36596/m.103339 type:complete len:217 (+) Transcript_36596:450-1100(+)
MFFNMSVTSAYFSWRSWAACCSGVDCPLIKEMQSVRSASESAARMHSWKSGDISRAALSGSSVANANSTGGVKDSSCAGPGSCVAGMSGGSAVKALLINSTDCVRPSHASPTTTSASGSFGSCSTMFSPGFHSITVPSGFRTMYLYSNGSEVSSAFSSTSPTHMSPSLHSILTHFSGSQQPRGSLFPTRAMYCPNPHLYGMLNRTLMVWSRSSANH